MKNLKFFVKFLRYCIQKVLIMGRTTNFQIMTIEETLQYVIDKQCSVVRYGDGELLYISGKGIPSGFQKQDDTLRRRLAEIIEAKNDSNLLVCMPEPLTNDTNLKLISKMYWTDVKSREWKNYQKLLGKSVYGNAFISRPYMAFKDKTKSHKYFELLSEIWRDKTILLVEGSLSRTGVGNKLFEKANNVYRILCPSKDAFDWYEELYSVVLRESDKLSNVLILLAIGPTAKVLAYDLSLKGYQAIDIGHIDSEYEWFLRQTNEKVVIEGKHTAERDSVEVSECKDKEYVESIVEKVGI